MKNAPYQSLNTFVRNNLSILDKLGELLYVHMIQDKRSNIDQISEIDCINYIQYLVTEKTIYGQLQQLLGVKIEPAPDKWDRLYNIDFYIKINEKYIGLQIKPINKGIQLPEIHKEYALQTKTHQKFTKQFGGKVFYIFSMKNGDKREIVNKEVIEKIRAEMKLF